MRRPFRVWEGREVKPFECLVYGRAVSLQGDSLTKRVWRELVAGEARLAVAPGEPPAEGPVAVHLLFVQALRDGDLDNLVKNVLDALNTIVFADDRQVSDIEARRRWLRDDPLVESTSPLVGAAVLGGREFVYVSVTDAPPQEVIP